DLAGQPVARPGTAMGVSDDLEARAKQLYERPMPARCLGRETRDQEQRRPVALQVVLDVGVADSCHRHGPLLSSKGRWRLHNTVTFTRTSRKESKRAPSSWLLAPASTIPSMTTEMWIIAAVRVAGSLPVLRWPLAGAFIAIFVDLSDLFLRDWIDLGGVKDYQRFDKSLDQVYMLTFLLVALRWQAVPRNIAIALYAFRLVGSIAFEVTGARAVLILFPNAFEYWFIFVAALKHFGWEEPARRAQASPPTTLGESYSQSALGTRIDGAAQAQSRIVLHRKPHLT